MISDMNQQAIIAERELLKQRTREIEAVREIFRAVNAVSDLRSILDTVTRTATRALDSIPARSICWTQPAPNWCCGPRQDCIQRLWGTRILNSGKG
ncbi:MAG: hypothetical protein IPO29_17275 [Anaerolineae bacterium]|nr:hypothetical protein [Anaerolineae bacterium]